MVKVTASQIPVFVVLPIITTFGILFFHNVIKYLYYNKKLINKGQITKAQIIEKYERGSKDFYKKDSGKIYLFIVEWIITDYDEDKMLCKSKFYVDQKYYQNCEIGTFINLIYLQSNYDKYFNLEILNKDIIKISTMIKRLSISMILIFVLPAIIAILTKEWQFFVFTILIAMFYYIAIYYVFVCFCSDKEWFKNKSFQSRKATENDINRFNDNHDIIYKPATDNNNKDDKKISLLET